MEKIKVAALFGGMSTEHAVSCISAYSVLRNLDTEKFDVKMVGLTKQGDWLPYDGPLEAIRDGSWEPEARRVHSGMYDGMEVLRQCDVIFPILHGLNCEDGVVQGLFELLQKPYVGCGVLSSAVCMDKVYTKIIAEKAGIPQCKYCVVHRHLLLRDPDDSIREIEETLGFPCFVKPANSGSSVGVFKVNNKSELLPALMEAQKYDRKIVVEEFIDGREIECAVLGNSEPRAAAPGEIKPSKEFYDYEDKYQKGSSITEIPADLPEEKLEQIKTYAITVFKALDCSGLSRVDFFYEKKTDRILFNEINTLPGFTEISMYSKLWAAAGIPFQALLTELIALAFARREENKREIVL